MSAPRAMAFLYELRAMWGQLRVVEGTDEAPLIIERRSPLGHSEVWKYAGGKGTKALFALQGEG